VEEDKVSSLESEVELIEGFVESSPYLELTKGHKVTPNEIHVDIVNSNNAQKVMSELTSLVKMSGEKNNLFSSVIVKNTGSPLVKFYITYRKKVFFLNRSKIRITKDIATYIISDLKTPKRNNHQESNLCNR
jgi:hypothetical protein